jgi:hypothetical protein
VAFGSPICVEGCAFSGNQAQSSGGGMAVAGIQNVEQTYYFANNNFTENLVIQLTCLNLLVLVLEMGKVLARGPTHAGQTIDVVCVALLK